MTLPLHTLRLGSVRLTPYGACAALGVMGAMGVSSRAVRRRGLLVEEAWDTGLFAVLSCFAASRLLLILTDPKAFLYYPLLVLSLPSLTFGGIVLASVLVWAYLRHKRLPVLAMLDAFAPGGAVLALFLELGHLFDGSEPGMPLSRGLKDQAVRLLPVSLYGVCLSALLVAVLWVCLSRQWSVGHVAAFGLMLGGVLAFGLSMLSLPLEIGTEGWLEPGQWVALGVMTGGALMWFFSNRAPGAPRSASPAADISV